MDIDFSQQTDLFDPEQFGWPVHLIGIGGIGSPVAWALVKLGVHELTLWDFDPSVEPHNIPAQLIYRPSDVGLSKIEAALAFMERQEASANCEVRGMAQAVDESTSLEGVVISGVDSMQSRQTIWKMVRYNAAVPLYMDGRMGGEEIHLFTLNPNDPDQIARYESWLFTDEEAAELPCAARTSIGPPLILGGLIITQLTHFYRERRWCETIICKLQTMEFIVG